MPNEIDDTNFNDTPTGTSGDNLILGFDGDDSITAVLAAAISSICPLLVRTRHLRKSRRLFLSITIPVLFHTASPGAKVVGTLLKADVNGDGTADFALVLTGVGLHLATTDFQL
jgi:hypothetical protein